MFLKAASLLRLSKTCKYGSFDQTRLEMSPEQTLKPHANLMIPVSDIYYLGVIHYETLIGRPPFQADHVHMFFSLIQNESPIPSSQLLPRLDIDLETICLKCLNKLKAEPGWVSNFLKKYSYINSFI